LDPITVGAKFLLGMSGCKRAPDDENCKRDRDKNIWGKLWFDATPITHD